MRFEVRGVRVRDGKQVALLVAASSAEAALRVAEKHGVRAHDVRETTARANAGGRTESAASAEDATDARVLIGGSLAMALLGAGTLWLLASAGKRSAPEPEPVVAAALAPARPTASGSGSPALPAVDVEPAPEPLIPTAPSAPETPSPTVTEAAVEPAPAVAEAAMAPRSEPAGDTEETSIDREPRAGWLAQTEREALQAFGWSYLLDGERAQQATELSRLTELAERSPPTLARRLRTIVDAHRDMQPTADEDARFAELVRSGTQSAQTHLLFGLLDALSGRDPFDNAIDTVNGIAKDARVTEAWELQRRWLERLLEARQRADSALASLLDECSTRIDGPAGAPLVTWRLSSEGDRLVLCGRVDSELTGDSILQVVLHKVQSKGQWTAANVLSGGLARMLGVTALDGAAQIEGGRLAAAQERANNLPLVTTMLLPAAHDGASLRVPLGAGFSARDAVGLTHIEVHFLNQSGKQDIEQVAGLAEAQEAGRKVLAAERERARARGSFDSLFGSPLQPMSKEQANERVEANLTEAAAIVDKDQGRALRLVAHARKVAGDDRALLARCDAVSRPVISALERERDGISKKVRAAEQEVQRRSAALARDRRNAALRRQATEAKNALSQLQREQQRVQALLAIR